MSIIGAAQQQDRNHGGATLWTPSANASLRFHGNPKNTGSVQLLGSEIIQLNDLSSHANHLVFASGNRPLNTGTFNGHPSMTFINGKYGTLTAILPTGPCTIAMVVKDTSAATTKSALGDSDTYIPLTSQGSLTAGWSRVDNDSSTTGLDYRLDGESTKSVATRGDAWVGLNTKSMFLYSGPKTPVSHAIEIGRGGNNNGYSLQGEVGEILIFSTDLIEADKARVQGYLAWEWGFQADLGAGHTYFGGAPAV